MRGTANCFDLLHRLYQKTMAKLLDQATNRASVIIECCVVLMLFVGRVFLSSLCSFSCLLSNVRQEKTKNSQQPKLGHKKRN